MTIIANTFTRYASIGIREELSNIIDQARLNETSTDWPEGNGEQGFY